MSLPILTAVAAAVASPQPAADVVAHVAESRIAQTSRQSYYAQSVSRIGIIVGQSAQLAADGASNLESANDDVEPSNTRLPHISADIDGVMGSSAGATVPASLSGTITVTAIQSSNVPTAIASDAEPVAPEIQSSSASNQERESSDPVVPSGLTVGAERDEVQPIDPDENIIVVTGGLGPPPGDPLIKLNEEAFEVTQKLDEKFVEPVANTYEKGLPAPVRDGLSNFFNNVREPIAFVNYVLQGNPGGAAATLGRFAVNSTIGLAGLIDVAEKKPFNLPRTNNGFANTLGYFGVPQGAFLVLPGFGPTTVRDFVGNSLDAISLVGVLGFSPAGPIFSNPAFAASSYTVRSLDDRIAFRGRIDAMRDADYPYATLRETYLCGRKADIAALKGRTITADECGPEAILPPGIQPLPEPTVQSAVAPEIPVEIQTPTAPIEPIIEFYSKPVIQPLS